MAYISYTYSWVYYELLFGSIFWSEIIVNDELFNKTYKVKCRLFKNQQKMKNLKSPILPNVILTLIFMLYFLEHPADS